MSNMKVDLNDVVDTKEIDGTVVMITKGTIACSNTVMLLRDTLKLSDPEGYNTYRAVKYPAGEGSATPETRVAAIRFLFDRVRDLLIPHYVPSN